MNIKQIKEKINSNEYEFLRTDKRLQSNIILLGLGGSHAYGTNNENSDLDIRGCTLNSKREILTNENFNQITDEKTDTVIYSFNRLVSLLINSNPNVIEILGLKKEHYLHVSVIGQELLDNSNLFLSKKCINSFGGYATSQLRRLDNKAIRTVEQELREKHILNSIMNAFHAFPEKYFNFLEDNIKLYIDKSDREEYDSEIFMDINLKHYPLRDYKAMWSEMNNVVKDYSKIGKRNKNAIEHEKLGKYMMHLIRLHMMCLDILEKEKIITYRENEHDLLMDIRNGKYLDSNNQPVSEFYDVLNEYEKKMEYAKINTNLQKTVDYNKIADFIESVNERIIKGDIQ